MKTLVTSAGLVVLSLVATCVQALASDEAAGVRRIVVASDERGTDLDVTIWYPAAKGGEVVILGESIFFEGTSAREGHRSVKASSPLSCCPTAQDWQGRPRR